MTAEPCVATTHNDLPTIPWARLGLLTTVIVLIGASVGYGVSLLLPPQYSARADVLYLVTREQPTGFLREDRNLTTQLVLLTSRSVLEPVARANLVPVDELDDRVTAEIVDSSEVIRIEVRDGSPEGALSLVRGIVDRYLEVGNNDERAALRQYLDGELRIVLDRIADVRADSPVSAAELGPLVDRELSLRGQLDELRLSDLAGPASRVLVEPYALPDRVSPRPLLAAATGALSGLLIAAVVVAVLARRWTRA